MEEIFSKSCESIFFARGCMYFTLNQLLFKMVMLKVVNIIVINIKISERYNKNIIKKLFSYKIISFNDDSWLCGSNYYMNVYVVGWLVGV